MYCLIELAARDVGVQNLHEGVKEWSQCSSARWPIVTAAARRGRPWLLLLQVIGRRNENCQIDALSSTSRSTAEGPNGDSHRSCLAANSVYMAIDSVNSTRHSGPSTIHAQVFTVNSDSVCYVSWL